MENIDLLECVLKSFNLGKQAYLVVSLNYSVPEWYAYHGRECFSILENDNKRKKSFYVGSLSSNIIRSWFDTISKF